MPIRNAACGAHEYIGEQNFRHNTTHYRVDSYGQIKQQMLVILINTENKMFSFKEKQWI